MKNTGRKLLRKRQHLSTAGQTRWQWLNTASSIEQMRALIQERARQGEALRVIQF